MGYFAQAWSGAAAQLLLCAPDGGNPALAPPQEVGVVAASHPVSLQGQLANGVYTCCCFEAVLVPRKWLLLLAMLLLMMIGAYLSLMAAA
jgi:hypothetical protein